MPKEISPKPECQLCGKAHTTRAHETDPNTFYEWTVKFRVSATWIADGFDLDDDRAFRMLQNDLRHAYTSELSAKVVKAPNPDRIAWEQGYRNADVPQRKK